MITIQINAQGQVCLVLDEPTPVPVHAGEQLPDWWKPSPGSGQGEQLVIQFPPAGGADALAKAGPA